MSSVLVDRVSLLLPWKERPAFREGGLASQVSGKSPSLSGLWTGVHMRPHSPVFSPLTKNCKEELREEGPPQGLPQTK